MREIIKYETDENGENSRLMSMASGDTTMKVIARLLLQMAKMTKGGLSVDMMLDMLKEVYIPAMIVEMAGDTVYEEVIDPE
ncbi:MAG: hypothetical protein IIZ78_01180 [Clostridiales bacterium]|nr:hypothetical protein [Clostridiales bacterium]